LAKKYDEHDNEVWKLNKWWGARDGKRITQSTMSHCLQFKGKDEKKFPKHTFDYRHKLLRVCRSFVILK